MRADRGLFVVIGFAAQNGHGSVELFGEKQAHHLVREGETRERNLAVGAGIDRGSEPVGAANDKDQTARAAAVLPIEKSGQFDGAEFPTTLIEQPNGIAFFQRTKEQFTFALFLLFERERFGVLQFRDDFHFKRNIVFDTAGVVVDQGRKMLVDGATHNKKKEFHEQKENEGRAEKIRGNGGEIVGEQEGGERRKARKTKPFCSRHGVFEQKGYAEVTPPRLFRCRTTSPSTKQGATGGRQ